jgi:hypothetical protein
LSRFIAFICPLCAVSLISYPLFFILTFILFNTPSACGGVKDVVLKNRSCHSREYPGGHRHGNPEGGHQGLIKRVLGRFALLSGFRIKCGMTEFKAFDTPLFATG